MKWMSFVIAGCLVLGSLGCGGEKGTVQTKDGGKFTVTLPENQSLNPGESTKLKIKVDREGFDEDISVKFEGLPEGVRVVDADRKVKKGEKEQEYVLDAKPDAKPVKNHKVKVIASGKGSEITREFGVTINEKK
jgi:hypothetical protein